MNAFATHVESKGKILFLLKNTFILVYKKTNMQIVNANYKKPLI